MIGTFKIKVDGVQIHVDERGRVGKMDKTGRIRWMHPKDDEIGRMSISINGRAYSVDALCMGAFAGGILSSRPVKHLNGDLQDCSKSNLRYK